MRTYLACVVILSTGCSAPPPVCVASSTHGQIYRVTQLTLPQSRADFAYDLNGDGKLDNQLGKIVNALTAGGVDAQASVDGAIGAGADPMELQLFFDDSAGAASTFGEVLPQHESGLFCSPGGATQFSSLSTADMTRSIDLDFTLSFAGGAKVLLRGAHLQFDVDHDLLRGELHGGVRADGIEPTLVAGIAELISSKLNDDPDSNIAQQLRLLFDTNGDGQVTTAEVAASSILRNVLAPDVDLFDDQDQFHPNPANDQKDSFSLGVGFVARRF